MPRISIKTVYMQNAYQYATLSYAERRKVGCVIVKDHQVISFGYNGTPHGFDNECEINDMTKPEVLHAESNAIMKVAKSTMSCEGAELYTTTCPCFGCAKLIIQAGIATVYYTEEYRDMSGVALLGKAGIVVEHLKLENEYK